MENFKLELIEKIIQIDDSKLLLKIKNLIENSNNDLILNEPEIEYKKGKKVYVFNEWQKKRIDISLKQVENGECISNEEAEIDIERWFKEQEK